MARKVTVTFDDGSTHVYENAPDSITPEIVQKRAEAQFGKVVTGIDGGRTESSVPPAPTIPKQVEESLSPVQRVYQDVKGRIQEGTILRPGEEDFLRKTLQGAASGPLSGIVQAGAGMLGAKDVESKIAQTAKEGNLVGAFLNPESVLTGKTAANFIGQGANLLQKGLRASPIGGMFGLTAPTESTEKPLEDRMKTAATTATVSFVSPYILDKASKGVGWAVDMLRGRLADIKAGKVMRDMAGEELPKIQAALSAAGDDVTAAQAAAGAESRKFSALGQKASEQASDVYGPITDRQAAARQAVMDKMAGGASGETTAAARAEFLKKAEAELGPRRAVYLAQLASPGQELSEILPKLKGIERQYVMALREGMPIGAPMTGQATVHPTTEAAQSMVRNQQGAPGWISNADRAGEWQGASKEFQALAKELRAEAGLLRKKISELPSAFTAAPVRNAVDSMASSTVNPAQKQVLGAVSDALKVAGDDPVKIAEVRRLGVNQLIGDLVQSGKVSKTDAAAALGEVKGLIDKQLGNDFVSKYLKPYSDKLANKDAMELADELRYLMKNNPKKFVEAMRGEAPELVEKFSATAKTMQEALGDKRFKLASKAADEIARDLRLKDLASEGSKEMAATLRGEKGRILLPAFVDFKIALARAAGREFESAVDSKALAKIYAAMKTGKTANDLMSTLSTAEKNLAFLAAREGKLTPYLNSAVVEMQRKEQ